MFTYITDILIPVILLVFQIDDNVLWHVPLLKNNVVPFYGMKYNNTTKSSKLDNDKRI